MDVLKFKIDLKSELDRIMLSGYRLYIVDKTIDELTKLSVKNMYAKMGLQLVKDIEIIDTEEGYVDDWLVKLQDENTIIATDDKDLKRRLKCQKVFIKNKSHLGLN